MKGLNLIFLGIICVLVSCNNKQEKPDISNVNLDLKFYRFDSVLFSLDPENIRTSIPHLQKVYAPFYELFNQKIIEIGSATSIAYPEYLKTFLTDFVVNQAMQKTHEIYGSTINLELKIRESFKYYHYYFPSLPTPNVYTFISGFNHSIVTDNHVLGIGLDKYLGSKYEMYFKLGFPQYKTRFMIPERIPVDAMRGWAISEFPMSDSIDNLLSNMIYQGKILFLTQQTIPEIADTLLFGFTNEQNKFVQKNENQMWMYLVENKQLFTTDYMVIGRFIKEAPFTKDFSNASPGQAALWIGYKIVVKYMDNSGESIENLMKDLDYQKILRVSKYNPR